MADAGTGHFGDYIARGLTGGITSTMRTEIRNWGNLDLRTDQVGNQSVKLNSRDYTATSGEHNAVQSKPNVSVGGCGITGFESSPRFADTITGGKLVAFKANTDIKGSSGNIDGPIRQYEAKFDGGTGRTVAGGAYVLDCMSSNAATITGGMHIINVNTHAGGGTGWTGLVRFQADGTCCTVGNMYTDPDSSHAEAGYFKIHVAAVEYQVPFYASA